MPNFKEFIKGFEEAEQPKEQEVKMEEPKVSPEKTAYREMLKKRGADYGSIVKDNKGRKYLIEEPEDDEQVKLWGKSHLLAHQLDENEKPIYEIGSRGWTPAHFFDKGEKSIAETEPKPQPKEEPLFDERKRSTKKGLEEAKNFLDAKGVKDIYTISNEQFDALADEAAKKYGISQGFAKEFLVAPYEYDPYKYEPDLQPKQGSFKEVFGEEAKEDDWDNDPELQETPYGNVKNYKKQSITKDGDFYSVFFEGEEPIFETLADAKEFIDKNFEE